MRPLTDRQRAIVLVGLTLAGLALRLLGLSRLPLWADEQASVIESQGISMTDSPREAASPEGRLRY